MVFVCVFVLCGQRAKNKLREIKGTFRLELGWWTAVMTTVISGNDSSSGSGKRQWQLTVMAKRYEQLWATVADSCCGHAAL